MPPFLNPLLTLDPRRLRTPDPELPIRPSLPLPAPSAMPRVGPGGEALRQPVELPEMPAMRPTLPAVSAPPIATPERKTPELSRVGVPIPALPGDAGPKPYTPIEAARYDAGMKRAKRDEDGNLTGGFKRSKKDILLNALYGFGQGAQQGGLFGGLGGAAAGAIGTAVNPSAGAEHRFNIEMLPRMQADEARTQAAIKQARDQEAAQLGTEKAQVEIERIQADIANQKAVQEANARKEAQEAGKLIPVAPGGTLLDPKTRQPVFTAPREEDPRKLLMNTPGGTMDLKTRELIPGTERQESFGKSLQEAEAERSAEEGSPEEIARASMEGRRDALIQSLPPQIQQALSGVVVENGVQRAAYPDEVAAAERTARQVFDDEYRKVLAETKGIARSKASERATGRRRQGGGASTSGGAPKMKLSEAAKYLQ